MKVCWFFCAPFATFLAARIGWEKTVWTWTRGPQMVGFSLWHVHPLFAVVGVVSFWMLLIWSTLALVFLVVRRKRSTAAEIAMFACAVFVLVAMMLPDTFLVSAK